MMKLPQMKFFLSLFLLTLLAGYGLSATTVYINGDNVNLRSSPTNSSEVVAQVSTGELLECTGRLGDWLQVIPPQKVDVWVYDEFVVDDKVVVSKLKARCGPGINYRVVGVLRKNDEVVSRGVQGEWRKIAPPSSSRIWVSRHYASVFKPKAEASGRSQPEIEKSAPKEPQQGILKSQTTFAEKQKQVVVYQTPRKSPDAAVETKSGQRDLSALIDVERLQTDVEQGAIVKRAGVLKPAGLAWRRPSEYRLVVYDKWDRAVTICYVLVDDEKLAVMLDKDVFLIGNEYWIKGVRYPVVIASSIVLND